MKTPAPKVHHFDNSGDAYNASQCDDTISDGDVLIVKSESVVGILLRAWPVAITTAHGEFHTPSDPAAFDWSAQEGPDGQVTNYSASLDLAKQEVAKLGDY